MLKFCKKTPLIQLFDDVIANHEYGQRHDFGNAVCLVYSNVPLPIQTGWHWAGYHSYIFLNVTRWKRKKEEELELGHISTTCPRKLKHNGGKFLV